MKAIYTSFGELKRQGDKAKNTYAFTGREYDSETGLYFYRARYYDAKIGRFISFDPILHPANGLPKCGQAQNIYIPAFKSLLENTQTSNPFVYTLNNPVNFSDPQGLFIPPLPPDLIPKIWCAYNEYKRGKSIKTSNDKYKHCITSCNIAKKCGIDISLLMGFAKEIKDLLDMDPNTYAEFADIVANMDGIACRFSSLSCEQCCCEKGYQP